MQYTATPVAWLHPPPPYTPPPSHIPAETAIEWDFVQPKQQVPMQETATQSILPSV